LTALNLVHRTSVRWHRANEVPKPLPENTDMSQDSTHQDPKSESEAEERLSSRDLLACPFCGQAPEYTPRTQGPAEHGPGAYWPEMVHCLTCHITFRRGENNACDPVARWNKRSGPAKDWNKGSGLANADVEARR
jgi:hypothetical protein